MKKRVFGLLIVAGLMVCAPLLGQMGMQMPGMKGIWNPVVGLGSVYEDSNKHQFQVSIVGKETFNGQDAYWMEMLMTDQRGQQMVMQVLMVSDGMTLKIVKTIMQMGTNPPWDMSDMMGMMGGRGTPPPNVKDFRENGQLVGKESVTTPAGTFSCDHWRGKDGQDDVWLSTGVSPWGFVKAVNNGSKTTMLIQVLTGVKSHLTGTPVKFDPSMMGRGRGQ